MADEFLAVPSDSNQLSQFLNFRNRCRHHGKTGSQILAQLQGVGVESQFVDDERKNRGIKSAAITREVSIGFLSEKVNIGNPCHPRKIRHNFSDQHEGPLGAGNGKVRNQLKIDPIRNESEEPDDGTRDLCNVFRYWSVAVARLAEVLHVDAVTDQENVGIVLHLVPVKTFRRYEYTICLLDQPLFHVENGVF